MVGLTSILGFLLLVEVAITSKIAETKGLFSALDKEDDKATFVIRRLLHPIDWCSDDDDDDDSTSTANEERKNNETTTAIDMININPPSRSLLKKYLILQSIVL